MTPELEKLYIDSLPVIDKQIVKHRDQWKLSSLAWMDYDDVSQIIRIHIYKKWPKYDISKSLTPWLNVVISHQIRNLVRNNFSNYARPCLKCDASLPDSGCEVYKFQFDACPLYAVWQKRKSNAYNIKIPLSLEFHDHETLENHQPNENLPSMVEELNKRMKAELSPTHWRVYEALYINGEEELEVAKKLGYRTTEKNRSPGYKQIKNIQKSIILKAKKCIYNGSIDIL